MSETPTVRGDKDEPEQPAETPDAPPEETVQPYETPKATDPASIPPALGRPSTVHSPPEMTMGAVLNEAFSLYKRFFSRFFLLALVVFLVLDLVTAVAAIAFRDRSGGGALLSLIAIVVVIVGESLLLGALVFAV